MYRSIVIAACALLCGCAALTDGTSQKIAISTAPVDGASCVLASDKGSWAVTSPGTVEVQKSIRRLTVTCTKPGFETAQEEIPATMDPWAVASVAFAGPVGVFVDTQTGAIDQYPKSFAVAMKPTQSSPAK